MRILATVSCLALLVCLSACQDGAQKPRPDSDTNLVTKAKAAKPLPDWLVGVWEAKVAKTTWGFRIESDSTISKLIHHVAGKISVAEGGYYVEGPDEGTYAVFTMGPVDLSS